jgi:hypothetical protein
MWRLFRTLIHVPPLPLPIVFRPSFVHKPLSVAPVQLKFPKPYCKTPDRAHIVSFCWVPETAWTQGIRVGAKSSTAGFNSDNALASSRVPICPPLVSSAGLQRAAYIL